MIDQQKREKRRVVLSGLGVVAPNGIGQEAFWQALSHGTSGIRPLQHHDPLVALLPGGVAGIVTNFETERYFTRKLANRTDRMTHLALAAIQEAISDAQLNFEQENRKRIGAVIANTLGGVEYVLKQIHTLYTRGPRFVSAYTAIAWLNVASVGQTAIQYGIQGYCKTPVNDTVGGLDALGMAYRAIKRGAADIIISGGCEAFLHPFILQIITQQGLRFSGSDPQGYRPFDKRAAGLIIAEGAGICILEEYEHARQRGAPIYGEIVAYAQTNDAYGLNRENGHLSSATAGKQYARALRLAMTEADLRSNDIAYISLDGRATTAFDQHEANALRLAFGEQLARIPVSVPRTTTGHSYAATGALDAISAVLALKHGLIPPTINCDELDPHYGLQMVRNQAHPTGKDAKAVLLAGRGIGGANVVLALKKGASCER